MTKLVSSLLLAAVCSTPALAAPPAVSSFDAVVIRAADADTFVCDRDGHRAVKVRLFGVDAPEIKHRPREQDQPGGQAALAYVAKAWVGKEVTITPKGESYGRVVAEVVDAKTGESLALDVVEHGHAWVDRRYTRAQPLVAAEQKAREEKRGLWAESSPVAPWDWRKQQRMRGRK